MTAPTPKDEKMTAHDIASEFVSNYVRYETSEIGAVIVERLSAIIKAAEDAARAEEFARGALDQQVRCKDHTKKAYAMGFVEAVEKAAQAAEKFERGAFWNSTDIASSIRALRPSGSGEA